MVKGVAGMKIIVNNFNAQASYDFSVGSEVTIRPELSYLYLKYYSGKTTYYDYGDGNGPQALSQYLGGAPELSIVSPALRASWAHNGFKLTGAVRADKTVSPTNGMCPIRPQRPISSTPTTSFAWSTAVPIEPQT